MEEGSVDIFSFTTLRAPVERSSTSARRTLIQDDWLHRPDSDLIRAALVEEATTGFSPGVNLTELFSQNSPSAIARRLMTAIRTELSSSSNAGLSTRRRNALVLARLRSTLLQDLSEGITYDSLNIRTAPVIDAVDTGINVSAKHSLKLTQSLNGSTIFRSGNILYRSPTDVRSLPLPAAAGLARLYENLKRLSTDAEFLKWKTSEQRIAVIDTAREALGLSTEDLLIDIVLDEHGQRYADDFLMSKRIAFDCYYAFYLLRRTLPVDLTPALVALRILNALEQLAFDEFLNDFSSKNAPDDDERRRLWLVLLTFPQLERWNPSNADAALQLESLDGPGIRSAAHLATALGASPVLHPVFVRLIGAFVPFNDIRPIGFGEMKVVRQKFRGYEKGEIAHIETVLAGEEKTRTHRRLDRSESSFSYSTSTDSSFSKDSQTTSRFEIKNESDRAVQLALGANAGTTLNFKGGPVLDSASVTAGVSLNASENKTERLSQSFAKEVVQKATESVQTKVAGQRSQTLSSENEETNVHKVINPASNGNISGIYLWLDKVYEGQVYDLGQRLMFEFVVPEPAAFYVDSRLQAYVRSLQLPRKPTQTTATPGSRPSLPVATPAEITQSKFLELAGKYELSRFQFPAETISRSVKNPLTQGPNFQMQRPSFFGDTAPSRDEAFNGDLGETPEGYNIDSFSVGGTATFVNIGDAQGAEQNTIQVFVNNQMVFNRVDETSSEWTNVGSGNGLQQINVRALNLGIASPLPLRIFSRTCTGHILNFNVVLKRTAAGLSAWQQIVFDEISRQHASKSAGDTSGQDYESKLAQYNEEIDKLSALELNDIIRGRSPGSNENLVREELKRQCLQEIAREFDSDSTDDFASGLDALGSVNVSDIVYRRLTVKDTPSGQSPAATPASFAVFEDKPDGSASRYVATRLAIARSKGRHVQFLEQAFDWGQLSYIFYPYFWAAMPRWIEMLDREDESDPLFTQFLRSGSARILLSVKPGYEEAVLHFIATGEPWDGGSPPVIGDATFIPLYEEVRAQQMRASAGTPVGNSWLFRVPTTLLYLESEKYPLVSPFMPDRVPS